MNQSPKYLIKLLETHGGFIFKHSKGSHQLYYNAETNKIVIVPVYGGKDIKKGTFLAILKQADLGKMVGTSGDIIGKYERDEIKPSIDIASKLADALNVSLDYLTGKTEIELDNSIIQRVVEIQNLSKEDKAHILYTLDGLLQNVRTKLAFGK